MLPALSHEVSQPAPGGRMPNIYPQRLSIAALCLSLAAGPLSAPQVSQIGVYIHLHKANFEYFQLMPLAAPGPSGNCWAGYCMLLTQDVPGGDVVQACGKLMGLKSHQRKPDWEGELDPSSHRAPMCSGTSKKSTFAWIM